MPEVTQKTKAAATAVANAPIEVAEAALDTLEAALDAGRNFIDTGEESADALIDRVKSAVPDLAEPFLELFHLAVQKQS